MCWYIYNSLAHLQTCVVERSDIPQHDRSVDLFHSRKTSKRMCKGLVRQWRPIPKVRLERLASTCLQVSLTHLNHGDLGNTLNGNEAIMWLGRLYNAILRSYYKQNGKK